MAMSLNLLTEDRQPSACKPFSSYSSLVKRIGKPSTWEHVNLDKEVKLVELSETSYEYNNVKRSVLGIGKKITKIKRVENPFLWGCYQLKKEECEKRGHVTEKTLFHVTGQDNVVSIVRRNLDWRKTTRAKFGQGVSFSASAHYANSWCNKDIGHSRAIIVTKVLVGSTQVGDYLSKVPYPGYDTTVDDWPVSKRSGYKYDTNSRADNLVYVKYYDNEFYPEHVVYYDNYDLNLNFKHLFL